MLKSGNKPLMISFDKLLGDQLYRHCIEDYFQEMGILSEIDYDFSESIRNNDELTSLASKMHFSDDNLNLENNVLSFHRIFEKSFLKCIDEGKRNRR
jgi:hypothetical protein